MSIRWHIPPTAPTNRDWTLGNVSADGQRMIASEGWTPGTYIRQLISLDGGFNWTEVTSTIGGLAATWGLAVTVSADGQVWGCSPYFDGVRKSTAPTTNWSLMTTVPTDESPFMWSNGDGSKVLIQTNNHFLMGSYSSLTDVAQFATNGWGNTQAAISRDGQRIIGRARFPAYNSGSYQYQRSENGGSSWTVETGWNPSVNGVRFAYSSGGDLAACVPGVGIFVSTDNGDTWNSTSAPALAWQAISWAGSSRLIASASGGGVWVSGDGGATWSDQGLPTTGYEWPVVGGSDDGRSFVALFTGAAKGVYVGKRSIFMPRRLNRLIGGGFNA